MMENRPIRWGLLGAGVILNRWLKGALQPEGMEISAIASRTPETASAMAEKWSIPRVMTYDEMVSSPDIDVVYIPVPHQARGKIGGGNGGPGCGEASPRADMEAPSEGLAVRVGAGFEAFPAVQAGGGLDPQFRFRVHPLRVVAPETAQGTALEEDRRADPRAVVQRETLDIEYDPGFHAGFPFLRFF